MADKIIAESYLIRELENWRKRKANQGKDMPIEEVKSIVRSCASKLDYWIEPAVANPDDGEQVIVTVGTPETRDFYTCICEYIDNYDGGNYINEEGKIIPFDMVTAWMHLPEPYREDY